MKKSRLFLVCIAVLLLAGIISAPHFIGRKPLKNLSMDEIEQVDVELFPPDKKITLTAAETAQLLPLLQDVVAYQEDNSYGQYSGQAVVFTISKKDGTIATVMAFNPYIVLNGMGFKTKYGPCEALNHFANELARTK